MKLWGEGTERPRDTQAGWGLDHSTNRREAGVAGKDLSNEKTELKLVNGGFWEWAEKVHYLL